MKRTFLTALTALAITASASAQSTVDSIASKYKLLPMPEALTLEKTFPILGTYELNNATASGAATTESTNTITVALDSVNKGVIWVTGLPQGRVKAHLRKSPATYRILPQKSETGKQIPEGILMLDPTTETLNIAIGAPYVDASPEAIFAVNATTAAQPVNTVEVKTKTKTSKTKSKVTFYTATKIGVTPSTTTTVSDSTNTQQQQPQQ